MRSQMGQVSLIAFTNTCTGAIATGSLGGQEARLFLSARGRYTRNCERNMSMIFAADRMSAAMVATLTRMSSEDEGLAAGAAVNSFQLTVFSFQ